MSSRPPEMPGHTWSIAAPARPTPRREPIELHPPEAVRYAIEVAHLGKQIGKKEILQDLSFRVEEGQIFGVIGPSGCGKTTLLRLLIGLDLPTDGGVLVDGVAPQDFDVRERERIGYAPQGFVLYPSLTVMQNSKFVASLYGVPWRKRKRRIRGVLQFLELWDARNRKATETSGGMQKRLSLACAIFHSPKLLFVDEPTAGLDPLLRAKVWSYLQDLRDNGTTVFVTTQHIDEAASCDRVAVLREGQLVADGTPDGLRRQAFGGEHIDIVAPQISREDVAAVSALPFVLRVNWNGGSQMRLLVSDIGRATADVTKVLTDRGTRPRSVLAHTPTFDEVFIELVGR